ncbi:MAG: LuxR C-terminal-related transcriptional regulator [Propionibacteriaceae bacterium]|nr:LuxR C-terminal-related transcriptional regulator [Propionibacteriaceae bacterium]
MNESRAHRRAHSFKSSVPSRSDRFVPRARLSRVLDEATLNPLTIVTGPAGVGKTLAVADWIRKGGTPGPIVWVNVDEADKDRGQMLASILVAVTATMGEDALDGVDITDASLAQVSTIAAHVTSPIVLVFDGCEKLAGGSSLAALDEILAHPSPFLRLVVISRHDPTLALHRLRLAGHLSEIRSRDLAFTSDEAGELLAQWDVELSDVALERLLVATEGWAAALRLAAYSLRHAENPEQLVERFDGINFLVSDYVWDEVLSALPETVTDLLQRTSISGQLCGSLARTLSGNPDAHRILQSLADDELLVQGLDGSGWYRTHPLLSRVLHRRLLDESPELERELQHKAVEWFETSGDGPAAISHAVETSDWELVGSVAIRSAASMIFSMDRSMLETALAGTPPPLTHDHGELAVAQALGSSLIVHNAEATAMLERAESLLPSIPEQRRSLATVALRVGQALQAHFSGDALLAQAAVRDAEGLLTGIRGPDAHSWAAARPRVALMRVGAALWAGDPREASLRTRRLSSGQPPGHPAAYTATYRFGLLAFMEAVQEEEVAEAHAMAQQVLDADPADGVRKSTEAQFAWLALGLTGLAHGDVSATRAALVDTMRATILNPNPHVSAMASITRARLEVAVNNLPVARRHLHDVHRMLGHHPGMTLIGQLEAAARVEVELASGSAERARASLDALPRASGHRLPSLVLAEGWVLLAQGSDERARAVVAPLIERRGVIGVSALLITSRAEDRLRRDARSIDAFARAIDTAADQEILHPFLRPSAWLTSYLQRQTQVVDAHHDFVVRALAAGRNNTTEAVAEQTLDSSQSLTERELSVLLYLPGMSSNSEIATALHISANTVKQHLKSSYRKLGVGTRRDAVRVARDRGLLPR